MPARKIDFYLNSSDRFRSLTRDAQRIAELDRILADATPPGLTQACCVKRLRDGTLTLLADNAAVAAKLKQLTARLLTAYQKQRSQVTSIRIEVQVMPAHSAPAATRAPRPLTIEAIENLRQLAGRLDDSPLKTAVMRLASRQRKEN